MGKHILKKGEKGNKTPSSGSPQEYHVYYGKEVGVKPTKKIKATLQKDANDISDRTVAESAEEDTHE